MTRVRTIGLAGGLALFVALGLVHAVAARFGAERTMRAGPIDASAVAPAEQLGRAFSMVAAHVRPCVVSVYSEKSIRISRPDLFGDELFRRFFGESPQERGGASPRVPRPAARHGLGDDPRRAGSRAHQLPPRSRGRCAEGEARGQSRVRRRARQRGSEDRRGRHQDQGDAVPATCRRSRSATPSASRSVASCSRSALPSAWRRRSPRASSAPPVDRTSASSPTRSSCRPTRRSIPATPVGRWSTCGAQVIGMNTAIASGVGQFAGVGLRDSE